jgi:tRNA pseudouridine55 synthase
MQLKPGIYPIFKPKGPSSHQIINKLRKLTGIKKIGHAGTLDPLAFGVLVVAIGRENTRKIHLEVKKEKEYEAQIKLGVNSTTDDEEGEKTEVKIGKSPTLADIKKILPEFMGEISQTPPIYSAIKIKGEEAYKLARQGKIPEMKARTVLIKNIEILDYKWPLLSIKVICGSGVYIRSLARDIGKNLKTGGYMADLVRTRVGEYKLKDCMKSD